MQSRAETPNDAASPRQGLLALRVHRVIEETSDARSFVLDVPEELERELRYVPGQYLTVDVPWEGFRVHRCYSLSSTPGLDPRPTITVSRPWPHSFFATLLVSSSVTASTIALRFSM